MANVVNLERVRSEILDHLKSAGMVVFHSEPRADGEFSTVNWDTRGHPDFRDFVAAAAAVGVRMLTLHSLEFSTMMVEELEEQLEDTVLERDERRAVETRLRELRRFDGSTCELELSFDHGERVYVFELRTEWYDELLDLLDQADPFDLDENPMGGYLSNN